MGCSYAKRQLEGPRQAQQRPQDEAKPANEAALMAIHIKKSHRGLLHKKLGIKSGKKIPLSELMSAKHSSSPAKRKEANFAINARSWKH